MPDFWQTFSSVQVNPDKYKRHGNFLSTNVASVSGMKTEQVIDVFVCTDKWVKRIKVPFATLVLEFILNSAAMSVKNIDNFTVIVYAGSELSANQIMILAYIIVQWCMYVVHLLH